MIKGCSHKMAVNVQTRNSANWLKKETTATAIKEVEYETSLRLKHRIMMQPSVGKDDQRVSTFYCQLCFPPDLYSQGRTVRNINICSQCHMLCCTSSFKC